MKERKLKVVPSQPQQRLLDPNFKYIPASQTDILKRFKQMGWVPPSEKKNER